MVTMKAALIGAAMAATVVLAGSASAQSGGIANTSFTANPAGTTTSPSPTTGFTLAQNFNSCTAGSCAGMSGSYHIFTNDVSNQGTVPFSGDTTPYLAVLASDTSPVATYTFTTPVTSVQFDWGTAASTDSLTLLTKNSAGVASSYTYTVPNSGSNANGATAGANYNLDGLFVANASAGYVITGLQFAATQNSFEVENIAVATPEPATWGMMILGFGMVGAGLRSRRRNGTLAVA